MPFKMKGSPAKLGTIQGTSGHASALKQTKKAKSDFDLGLEAGKLQADLENLDTGPGDNKKKVDPSEKTKNLRRAVTKADKEAELTNVEREKAEKKEGKYGKGLFGGHFRRKKAKRKHKRASKKEDRTREQLAKSEAWDKLTPEQKETKRREKLAFITAMVENDARAMNAIAQQQKIANVSNRNKKINKKSKGQTPNDITPQNSFANIHGASINPNKTSFVNKYKVNTEDQPDYSLMSGEELTRLSGHDYYKDQGFFPYNKEIENQNKKQNE